PTFACDSAAGPGSHILLAFAGTPLAVSGGSLDFGVAVARQSRFMRSLSLVSGLGARSLAVAFLHHVCPPGFRLCLDSDGCSESSKSRESNSRSRLFRPSLIPVIIPIGTD